jgi:signal transduction histidine kinase
VEEILTLMERLLSSHRIEVVRDFGQERPQVIGVADNLRQVFMNLIINARDAMKDGGTLRVGVRTENSTVTLSFADSGPGIPPNIIPRIFEPFFTTKTPGEGTGLGLSVCYGIIKSHNGTITFRNTDSGGCFDIQLPVAQRKTKDESGG